MASGGGTESADKISAEPVIGSVKEPDAEPEEEQKEDSEEMAVRKVPLMTTGQGYKGFLYIKCSKCGEVKAFCSKAPLKYCQCGCGNREELHDLVPVYPRCECGRTYKYLTNMEEAVFDIDCVNCGSPMSVQWNAKKRVYEPVNE